jgi:hypothetical protein
MPLGMSRASEYAGWWSSGDLVAKAEVRITTNTDRPFFGVTPRYYADYTNQTGGVSTNIFTGTSTGSNSFDVSGITNEPSRFVKAITMRFGDDFFTSTDSFVNGPAFSTNFTQSGLSQYRFLMNYNNALQFTACDRFDEMVLASSQTPASLRGRWVAWVAATSDTSSTFANWNPAGFPSDTYSWYQRQILVDLESGTILRQKDSNAGSSAFTYDLTAAWVAGGAGSSLCEEVWASGENWTTANWQDIQFASCWVTAGNTFDPAEHWPAITGSATPSSYLGELAWTNTVFPASGTALTDAFGTYGYRQTIGSLGSRQPAGWRATIQSASGSAVTAPVWTSF